MIYLVKHPETENNVAEKLTGWQKSEYTEKGKNQFKKIVKYFEDKDLNVFSSDLPRALMLGNKIASVVCGGIVVDKSLREQNFKETLPKSSFENKKAFRKRVFDWIDENKMNGTVIVSHSGTIVEIILNLLGSDSLKHIDAPRDVIFKIETIKNENKLSVIQT